MSPAYVDTGAPGRRQRLAFRWVPYAPLAVAVVMRIASEPTANGSYLVLAGYALLGRPHLIRALVLSWLFTMISSGISADASLGPLGRYGVLFAAALSVVIHRHASRQRFDGFVSLTLLLGVFIIAHALMFSSMADVSVLKAVSWTMAMATCIAAWCGLTPWQRYQLSEQVFWGLTAVLVVSLPLAVTSLGYLRNGTGFQGILNHPQAFGPTMALLCAWATARLLGEARPPWWLLAIAGIALVAVFRSEARTAGLAVVLGVSIAIFIGPGLAGRSMSQMVPGLRSPRVWAVILTTAVAVLVMSATFSDLIQYYITKSGRAGAQGLWDAYELSRGRQMDAMLDNIRQQPWTGIGFGIDSEPELMVVSRDPIFGLPLGASIEKGVAPLMVLEELGAFGAILVAVWALRLFRSAARGGVVCFAVGLTVLFINFGEATLFSPGGFGLLSIVVLGWAYSGGRTPLGPRYG